MKDCLDFCTLAVKLYIMKQLLLLFLIAGCSLSALKVVNYCLVQEQSEVDNYLHLKLGAPEPLYTAQVLISWESDVIADTFWAHPSIISGSQKSSLVYNYGKGFANFSYYNLETFEVPLGDTLFTILVTGVAYPNYANCEFSTVSSWPQEALTESCEEGRAMAPLIVRVDPEKRIVYLIPAKGYEGMDIVIGEHKGRVEDVRIFMEPGEYSYSIGDKQGIIRVF